MERHRAHSMGSRVTTPRHARARRSIDRSSRAALTRVARARDAARAVDASHAVSRASERGATRDARAACDAVNVNTLRAGAMSDADADAREALLGARASAGARAWSGARRWVAFGVVLIGTVVMAGALAGRARGEAAAGETDARGANAMANAKTVAEWGKGMLHSVSWDEQKGFRQDGMVTRGKFERDQAALGESMIRETVKKYYPSRIAKGQQPFTVFYTVEDYPQTRCWRSARTLSEPEGCNSDAWAPVYNFASQPRDGRLLPAIQQVTLITMAEPLLEILSTENGDVSTNPPVWTKQEIFGRNGEHGSQWAELIPKIVWRGSDYRFLVPEFEGFKEDSCHEPSSCLLQDLDSKITNSSDPKQPLRDALAGDAITPRLRLVLTSLLDDSWVDARFYCIAHYDVRFNLRVVLGKKLGVEAHQKMTGEDLAKYKYHIDLGGAGGTTWTGTIHKMSLPGVLFHHETSMRDSYFDDIKPWVHYIPVKENLSDLREKFKWAEAHPKECQRISAAASEWVKKLNTRAALLRHNYDMLAVKLKKTLDPSGSLLVPFERAHPHLAPIKLGAPWHGKHHKQH